MRTADQTSGLCWDQITGINALAATSVGLPQGILVPDRTTKRDKVAVIYGTGHPPPRITVHNISEVVSSVHADGIAVAVVARADGPGLCAEDVLLVECLH